MKILRGFTPSSFSIDQHIPESLIVLISRERLAPWKKYWEAHIGLSFFFFFLAFFFIIAARRPDIMLNAQLWAEDGAIWLQAIYADGLISLLFPMNGYYQTISRAILGFALLFGMDNVAFVANICAISIRSLLALFLLTSRLSSIDIRYRIVAVMYFLMMPNIAEGYVNATNTHWYTALYIMSIILADDPKTRAWKVHDCIVAIIGGLSGPFIVFLAPALLVKRLAQHRGLIKAIKGINAFDIAFTICFSVQLFAILCTYM